VSMTNPCACVSLLETLITTVSQRCTVIKGPIPFWVRLLLKPDKSAMIANVRRDPAKLSQGELGIPFCNVIIPAPTDPATMTRMTGYTQFKTSASADLEDLAWFRKLKQLGP
jgi:hypothetical protein